jgi:dynein heavy chain
LCNLPNIQEFQTLIKGGAALDLNAVAPKPASWILDITWLNIISLSELHQYDDLPSKVNSKIFSSTGNRPVNSHFDVA